ncbi:putative 2b protein [Citrus variegation virus]|uniref:Putative 2b protein n=1 Tax=Citrus variegation virus TaxID=37127 RepID=A5JVP6_9BROM|nr:putative 2b protein [Citrus variegation virus]ABQ45982.1 putative 2b protein [Citrus variegation virus]
MLSRKMNAQTKVSKIKFSRDVIVDAGSSFPKLKPMIITGIFLLVILTSTEARQFPILTAVPESAPTPPARLIVKIPDLAIDFELKEFTNPAVVIQTVYRRIIGEVPKGWYGLKSWSSSNYGDVVTGLKRAARAKVHFSIPDSDWAYTLNLSEVVSGFALPKLPIPEKYLRMPISYEMDVSAFGDRISDRVPSPWYLVQ